MSGAAEVISGLALSAVSVAALFRTVIQCLILWLREELRGLRAALCISNCFLIELDAENC